ncbi:MAG: hypothetical protein ABJB74_05060 [Gemmatimonas sp.]
MTLMEAVVALLILALVGVGCLELTQGASNLEYSATQWNAAISAAESRMAQVTSNAAGATETSLRVKTAVRAEVVRDADTQVTREPWRSGLDLISVSVPVANGKRYVLRRLVPAQVVRSASAAR